MNRLTDVQTQVLLAVLVTAAVFTVVTLWRAQRNEALTGHPQHVYPTLWERHTARLALWFGEDTGEPLSPCAQRYLTYLRDKRALNALTRTGLAQSN